jgi:hypothetical protein
MIAIWASGPPNPRAARQFAGAKERRTINGREYTRQSEVRPGQDRLLQILVEMLQLEGWADVRVVEGDGA